MNYDFYVDTKSDLVKAIQDYGFVPYFRNEIPGFSLEEHVSERAWFSDEEGVWEWKGPVIQETRCAYGKFFWHKTAFISRGWYPDFANYRRDGYDYDARYNDGLASYRDLELYELIVKNQPISARRLKNIGDYRKGGKKGFDTIMNRLQAQGYVLIDDFVYALDHHGNPYGWGVSEYMTPEMFMGEGFTDKVYQREPEESYERIVNHLRQLFPETDIKMIKRMLK